ncbi:MAG: hypothetical protein IJ629_01670 [Clostridia bacterium]|nr:hypothetical protein [Clostridia bacterium]
MKILTYKDIKDLNISADEYYQWTDEVLRNRDSYIMPTKTRIPMRESDYFNVMPCALPSENSVGLKVITRNEQRREEGSLNLDAQIYLYSYDKCELLAILDGNYITTIRTAAIAVHTFLNLIDEYETVAMVGLGNIGTKIGDILFEKTKNKKYTVKLYKYKGQEERFIERFKQYTNINFVICDTYDELMKDSDAVFSSVTFAEEDFCDASVYKEGCLVIPVHMRGFMGCDLTFDHIIASDMERIKNFKYYDQYKKLSSTDDVLFKGKTLKEKASDRVIVYNLGLSITDLYFASKIYHLANNKVEDLDITIYPEEKFYI